MAMRCCKLSAFLVLFQLILGIILTAVTCYLLDFSPKLPARDTPYWAGLPLVVTGITGIIFLTCCLKDYPENPLAFCIKITSCMLSTVSICACLSASVFAAMHVYRIDQYKRCERSTNVPHHSDYGNYPNLCLCSTEDASVAHHRVYGYDLQKCEDVHGVLYVLFMLVSVTSALAAINSILYVSVMWLSHYDHFYSGRKTIN
ncbi:Uncharacterised protein g9398 [Pycnogonum litorale]